MTALAPWLVGVLLGSTMIVAVAAVLHWLHGLTAPPAAQWYIDKPQYQTWARPSRLSLLAAAAVIYSLLLAAGLSTRRVSLLVSAEAVYVLVWAVVAKLVSTPSQLRARDESRLEFRFDEKLLARRRRRANIWATAFMALSVAVVCVWLTPEANDQVGQWLASCGRFGVPITAAVVWVLAIVAIIAVDRRYGPAIVDDLFTLMSSTSAVEGIALLRVEASAAGSPALYIAWMDAARAEQALKLLLLVEEQAQAARFTFGPGASVVDVMGELPEMVRAFIGSIRAVDESTARRYEERVRGIIKRLLEADAERSRRWIVTFPHLAPDLAR